MKHPTTSRMPVARPDRIRALAVTCIVTLQGCFPYHGKGDQLPIPQEPLPIVDGRSGRPIQAVLVLPRYSSGSGVSTGAGHGPGASSHTFYLAHPFIYRQGEPFAPSQPSSTGIVWGWFWAFTGTGKGIDGVLLVAPGYESRWHSDLWSRGPEPVAMVPLPREAALAEIRDIQRLLEHEVINGDATLRFSLVPRYALYVRIEASERAAVDAFLDSGAAHLDSEQPAPQGLK